MRIALVGATSRTGAEVIDQALAAGHEIVAYARRPEALEARIGVTVVGGQLEDVTALEGALEGCDAVVVTLGPKVSQPNAPIMSIAMPTVIKAATAAGVDRVVVLSALGAGDTFANTQYPYRFGCRTFLAGNFRDHVAGESQLIGTDLNWTTVHPGPLSDGPRTASPLVIDAATGYKMPRTPRTARADVAATILASLDDHATFGKQMMLTSAVQTA